GRFSQTGLNWPLLPATSTRRISSMTSSSSPVALLADIYNRLRAVLPTITRMSQMKPEKQIDYIELPASDLPRTKEFYARVFDWKFADYGPTYTSFFDGRMAGGFTTDAPAPSRGLLLVIYASDLGAFQKKIESAGGKIVKDTFSF